RGSDRSTTRIDRLLRAYVLAGLGAVVGSGLYFLIAHLPDTWSGGELLAFLIGLAGAIIGGVRALLLAERGLGRSSPVRERSRPSRTPWEHADAAMVTSRWLEVEL